MHKKTFACFIFCIAYFFSLHNCASKSNIITGSDELNHSMKLTVGVFQDERIEKLNSDDVREILQESLNMLEKKFGHISISFEIIKEGNLEDFFTEARQKYPRFNGWISKTYLLMNSNEESWQKTFEKRKPQIIRFLKENWELQDLNNYYKAKNYEHFTDKLIETYIEKLKKLKTYKMKNQENLFSKNPYLHSYKAWEKLMEYQDSYDIILTNTILVYDDFLKPYPHVVFKHAKVSGGSFESPYREGFLAGVSSFSSVFELYSQEPYFLGEKTANIASLTKEFMNKAIGGYLMAHELGHQIFWIPDVYNHPAGCLMDTKIENLEIGDGYNQLLKGYPVCLECQKYVRARNELFAGQKELKKGDKEKARLHIIKGLKMLPERLDRDRDEIESYFMRQLN